MCRACESSVRAAMVCRGSLAEYLAELPLFRGLSAAQLARVAGASRGEEIEAGQWLFREADVAHHLYLVVDGQIALLRQSLEGKESIVALVGDDEALGEELLFQEPARRDLSARATSDCALVRIERRVFRELVEESSHLARRLLQTVHRRQKMLVDHIERLSVQDAGGRVLNYLLALIGGAHGPQRVNLPIAKRDLAAHLAIQPETLSRVLAKMKSRELMWEEDGAMIVDVDELRAHRSCSACELNCWGCPRSEDEGTLPMLKPGLSLHPQA